MFVVLLPQISTWMSIEQIDEQQQVIDDANSFNILSQSGIRLRNEFNNPLRVFGIQSTSSSSSSSLLGSISGWQQVLHSRLSFLQAEALPSTVRILSLQPKGSDDSDAGGEDSRVILRLANLDVDHSVRKQQSHAIELSKLFKHHEFSSIHETSLTLLYSRAEPTTRIDALPPMAVRTFVGTLRQVGKLGTSSSAQPKPAIQAAPQPLVPPKSPERPVAQPDSSQQARPLQDLPVAQQPQPQPQLQLQLQQPSDKQQDAPKQFDVQPNAIQRRIIPAMRQEAETDEGLPAAMYLLIFVVGLGLVMLVSRCLRSRAPELKRAYKRAALLDK
jgi:hypothetical protein